MAIRKLLSLVLLCGSVGLGCSSESEATGGRRVVLRTRIAAAEAGAPFVNTQGWRVSLTKVFLATGPLYYFDGAPIFAWRAPAPTRRQKLEAFFGLRTAWAHPGHYVPGASRGQMLSPTSVDLSGAEVSLADGEGTSGIVRSATFSFQSPPSGPLAGTLGSQVAVLEGTASKGAETRAFRAEIDAADLVDARGQPVIMGCPFTETTIDADGTVLVTVRPALWFAQVEFDSLPPSPTGSAVVMPASAIARNQLVRGMRAGEGYTFSYSK